MDDILVLALVIVGYYALQRHILPRLGVST